jgi:hypothetical protein
VRLLVDRVTVGWLPLSAESLTLTVVVPSPVARVVEEVGAVVRGPAEQVGPPLVDDRGQAGHDRAGGAGAADVEPAAVAVGVVDLHPGVGVGDEGGVGDAAAGAALGDDAVLVGGLVLVGADAAAAAAPARLAAVVAAGGQVQRGAADGDDVGGEGLVAARGPAVAGRGQEGDAGVGEDAVEAGLPGPLAGAVAHRHRRGVVGAVLDGGVQVGPAAVVRLDEQDVGARGRGVGVLDVQGGL